MLFKSFIHEENLESGNNARSELQRSQVAKIPVKVTNLYQIGMK